MADARSYQSVWLTMRGTDTGDEFYKYRSNELPEVGEVIELPEVSEVVEVIRFLRDRSTRARVTRVGAYFQPRITAIQID